MADAPQPGFKSWQEMLDWMSGLLLRRTGHDVPWWLDAVRHAALPSEAAIRAWLTDNGVTGYAQSPVMWELFGYPDFFLKDAAELLDGQYADRPQLRPIADAVIALALGWAGDGTGQVTVQLRKTYVSLNTPRRKFAQVTPSSKSAVDIFLRLDEPAEGLLEAVKTRPDDAFRRRVRLRNPADVTGDVAAILLRAYRANA
ncbi:DUF5655 domain-containing protein [Arthrobacter dokdonensis]|uniref:DUF5655 domain-containing protein n=1 Tax=Arthrobacter dokdonellae TaxID=2211210 RepID=UPI001D132300|nr:DUF5655 domain-containing protein [Arthrobacter dokdonellae]